MSKLKTKKNIFVALILVIVIVITIGIFTVKNTIDNPFNVKATSKFEVTSGDTINSVITRLSNEGYIKNELLFKMYIKYKKFPSQIKVGPYALKSGETIDTFINDLNKGIFDADMVKVTIPEGYDIDQIADLLQKKGVVSKADFIAACQNYKLPDFVKNDSARRYKLEGYLFPDTYMFDKTKGPNEIIKMMLDNFQSKMTGLLKADNINLNKSDYDKIITMASIVEGEAEVDSERSIIASVFYNRLNIKMKLQSCATVEYALGYHKDKLYDKDIAIQSVYNTYLVPGLPEGPICNPGIKSIEAALKPSSTNYLYFVSKNNGTHYFTNNLNDFEKAKLKYQDSY